MLQVGKLKTILCVMVLPLFLVSANSFGDDFVWEPTLSRYQKEPGSPWYYNFVELGLPPLVLQAAGLGTGEGYGMTNPLVVVPGATTAYGGPAPASVVGDRPGEYYFGFASTYTPSDTYSAFDLGSTIIQPTTSLELYFRIETNDPINFIGICGGTDLGGVKVQFANSNGFSYLYVEADATNPVASSEGDQDCAFGLYINYGNYGEVDRNYDSTVFRTNVHWWDIDVPEASEEKLASIQLSAENNEEAIITASIPTTFFSNRGLNPNNVKGYVDQYELPMGEGMGETYSFEKGSSVVQIFGEDAYEYIIHNDQWSTHVISVGEIPEPATMTLLALGGMAMLKRRRQ